MRIWWLAALTVAAAACGGGDDGDSEPVGPYDDVPLGEVVPADGLSAPVHVVRDEFGVPHIYAQTIDDLAFANGYVMAADRIQQMDLFRHFASGSVSRLFGSLDQDVIDDDLEMRVHRLRHYAQLSWDELQASDDPTDQELVRYMLRFSDGINQYNAELLEGQRTMDDAVAVFFDPARWLPWTPVDSLALARLQAWSLSYEDRELDFTADYQRARELGLEDVFWDLYSLAPIDRTSTIDGFPNVESDTGTRARVAGAVRPQVPAELLRRRAPRSRWSPRHALDGSNNWVVGPQHAGGSTILANDPHLQLSSPSVFYLIHLVVEGDVDVAGISFPGIPGVILGHNDRIAWGGTVVNHDVTDFYLEQIVPCAAGGGDCVVFDGGEVKIETWTETLEVGALGTITETRQITYEIVPHHGPIMPAIADHDLVPRAGDRAISVKFTGYEPSQDLRAFARLWRADTVEEGMEGMRDFAFGGQNWVMVDDSGNIGWTTTARVPWRSAACFTFDRDTAPDGVAPFFVLPGDGSCEWEGWMSDRYMPHALNPAKGYLATANADPVGTTFDGDPINGPIVDGRPLYAGATDYANGNRVGRITRALEALFDGGDVTLDDMAAVQADAYSNNGALFTPHFVAAVAKLEEELATPGTHPDLAAFAASLDGAQVARLLEARDRLAAWSFDTPAAVDGAPTDADLRDSSATSIFNHAMVFYLRFAFEDDAALLGRGVGTGFVTPGYAVLARTDELGTGLAPETGEAALCDDRGTAGEVESCTLMLVRALHSAATLLAGPQGFGTDDMDAWTWGALHTLTLQALLPADELDIPPPNDPTPVLRGGYPRHGDVDSVDASSPGYGDFDFRYDHGPAMRHLTQFTPGAPPVTWMALPGGQSSDRASPHFGDLMDDYWYRNQYFALPFTTQEIVAAGELRLRLDPR